MRWVRNPQRVSGWTNYSTHRCDMRCVIRIRNGEICIHFSQVMPRCVRRCHLKKKRMAIETVRDMMMSCYAYTVYINADHKCVSHPDPPTLLYTSPGTFLVCLQLAHRSYRQIIVAGVGIYMLLYAQHDSRLMRHATCLSIKIGKWKIIWQSFVRT